MFRVLVEADLACFTRPECKVERVSYSVPTPSALVGMLKSVFWKPAIRYVIDRIVVFRPIEYAFVRRNEVKDKVLLSAIKRQMNGQEADATIYTKDCISQRSSVLLRNVLYGVEFHFEMTGIRSDREQETEGKYAAILQRRLEKGQWFRTPCMGCREFAVKRLEAVDEFDLSKVDPSLLGTIDLGVMLYDLAYEDAKILKEGWDKSKFSDRADPRFYHPLLTDGVIDVQKYAALANIREEGV